MHGMYHPGLMVLSIVIALLASYTTLELAERLPRLRASRQRAIWRVAGAAAMGIGIWSMHFIGMLALDLPVPLSYDLVLTAVSLALAVGAAYLMLQAVTRASGSPHRLLVGGLTAGLGIAAMHYSGMAALRMQPPLTYEPLLVAVSVVIAVGADTSALWLSGRPPSGHPALRRMLAVCLMGGAIAGMHYTGMAAAHFDHGAISAAANGANSHWLAVVVAVATLALLGLTITVARFVSSTSELLDSVSRLNVEVAQLAAVDALTQLPNRQFFTRRVADGVATARAGQWPVAVLVMDVDHFKIINDALGHGVGDGVLRMLATSIQRQLRPGATLARTGGDEFAVLLDDIATADQAERLAEQLLRSLHEQASGETPLHISISIGIAVYPDDGADAETLLNHADIAMHEAKSAGRGIFRRFAPPMRAVAKRRLQVQSALYEAIEAQLFSLRYQPKFKIDGRLAGAEVLIRLEHPQLGALKPAEFIPMAEASGQIVPIGYWVAREVCRQIRAWRDEGLQLPKLAINLSAVQLRAESLVATLRMIAGQEGVDAGQLCVEITESVAMEDADRSVAIIHEFSDSGFEVSIDDFGTGYSSLSYLHRFQAAELKIDQRFTAALDLDDNPSNAIVAATISMAHALNMRVVAEGVETQAQLACLRRMDCDEVQGYLLSRPLDADAFAVFIRTCGPRSAVASRYPAA